MDDGSQEPGVVYSAGLEKGHRVRDTQNTPDLIQGHAGEPVEFQETPRSQDVMERVEPQGHVPEELVERQAIGEAMEEGPPDKPKVSGGRVRVSSTQKGENSEGTRPSGSNAKMLLIVCIFLVLVSSAFLLFKEEHENLEAPIIPSTKRNDPLKGPEQAQTTLPAMAQTKVGLIPKPPSMALRDRTVQGSLFVLFLMLSACAVWYFVGRKASVPPRGNSVGDPEIQKPPDPDGIGGDFRHARKDEPLGSKDRIYRFLKMVAIAFGLVVSSKAVICAHKKVGSSAGGNFLKKAAKSLLFVVLSLLQILFIWALMSALHPYLAFLLDPVSAFYKFALDLTPGWARVGAWVGMILLTVGIIKGVKMLKIEKKESLLMMGKLLAAIGLYLVALLNCYELVEDLLRILWRCFE